MERVTKKGTKRNRVRERHVISVTTHTKFVMDDDLCFQAHNVGHLGRKFLKWTFPSLVPLENLPFGFGILLRVCVVSLNQESWGVSVEQQNKQDCTWRQSINRSTAAAAEPLTIVVSSSAALLPLLPRTTNQNSCEEWMIRWIAKAVKRMSVVPRTDGPSHRQSPIPHQSRIPAVQLFTRFTTYFGLCGGNSRGWRACRTCVDLVPTTNQGSLVLVGQTKRGRYSLSTRQPSLLPHRHQIIPPLDL